MIGISREDLLRYYIISQDNHYTFFNATDGEKKEIMNRITSADMILPVIEEIDRRNADLQERRGDIQREVDKLTERKETLEEQAEELVSANDDEGAAWTELEERAKEFDSKAEKARDAVRQLEKDYADAVRQRDSMKCDESKIQEWEDKIRNKRQEIDDTEEQIVECSRIKREIDLFFAGKVVCPKCGETFVPNGKLELTIPEAKKLYEQTEQNESKFYTILEQKKKNLKLYKDNKTKAVEAVDAYRRSDRAVQAINVNLQNQRDLVDSYVRRAEKARTDAKTLREDVAWKRQLEDLKKKIAETEKRLISRKKDLQPLDDELSLLKFWKYNMGRGGFQTYLANKSVSVIEGVTNSYLERFGVDIRVRISGFKVLKSGDVREKIDVFVSNNGIEWSAFMGKSGGERGRVTLAGVLGIQRLINLSTGGRGLDLLLFDECFHGMDSRGQENIIKVFEKMGSTIMVITQDVSESFNNENTLVVVKEGGESRYL
jgi:DNA repair exonuclease SbcCD ATPase subunit